MGTSRDIIIMVDDDITNLAVGMNCLADKYDVFTAPSGEKLFKLLERIEPSLILLDVEMPGMNGYETIKILKDSDKTKNFPVIFLTARIDPKSEVQGLSCGAVDYITKPFSRELLVKRVDMHILFEKQKKELLNYSRNLEGEVDKKTKTIVELQNAILKTVAELVERRDTVTGGHIERTQHYLNLIIAFLLEHDVYSEELSKWDIDLFIMSAQLHDVGKISIRDEILMKPTKLTEEEFAEIQKHTEIGANIIKKIEKTTSANAFLHHAELLAGSHHEKWNGQGYPNGLKGREIPLQGRIMAIVDVYDALTNERPYKKALPHEEAMEIILNEKGRHFDPFITEVFIQHEQEFKNLIVGTNHRNAGGKIKHAHNIPSALSVVSDIIDLKQGSYGVSKHRIRRYVDIFLTVLSCRGEYKTEMSEWDSDFLLIFAQMCDIGKIAVKPNILDKVEELTDEEFVNVKTHTDLGVKIIRQIKESIGDSSMLGNAETFAGSHHEKWDGTGYPLRLRGKEIPLQGRIMAIVDVYDALINDRPYRRRKTHKEAAEIIKSCAGTHFDPKLVEIFLENEGEFEKAGML